MKNIIYRNDNGDRVELTDSRRSIIGIIGREAPIAWKEIKDMHFGIERSKSASSTSFNTQLNNLKRLLVIEKTNQGDYQLTEWGKKIYSDNSDIMNNAVSAARRLFEQNNPQEGN